jgi:hypothetical protein
MSPIYFGGARQNQLRVGGTRINKGYVGSTLVYSSEFIGTVTITTVIRYAGVVVTDTNCVPTGAEVAMIASFSGTATDATFAWTRPAGSSAPVADLTTGTLTWTVVAGDGGTYGVTVTSRNSSDSTKSTQETINMFAYTGPSFADVDATQWITRVELLDCRELESSVRIAMNQLVLDLKTSGYFANSFLIAPLIGARKASSLRAALKGDSVTIIDNLSTYDRRKGLKTADNPTEKYAVKTAPLSLAASINAGSAGLATHSTECGGGPNTDPAFAQDGDSETESINAQLYGKIGWQGNGLYLTRPTGGEVYHSFGGYDTIIAGFNFVGCQISGPAATRTIKTRANNDTQSGVYNTNTPNSNTKEGIACFVYPRVDGITRPPVYFVRHSFLIAGGGSSDYSSNTLRTIIETYVTAIQAALPG